MAINWQMFGSNGHETADLSRGVLERFTRRAPTDFGVPKAPEYTRTGNAHVKTVANPRAIKFLDIPHHANYFEERHAVNENGKIVQGAFNIPVTAEKIVVNHYHVKSREEYLKRIKVGRSDTEIPKGDNFLARDRNDVFDDGILHYRDERAKTFQPPDKSRAAERLLNALTVNLSPTLLSTPPQKFYAGKMETFLTCRALAEFLKTQLADESTAKFFEEAALKAILKSAVTGMSFADAQLFIRELPNLLSLPYPAVKEIRAVAVQIISQLMHVLHLNNYWKDFVELDYILRLLQTWRPQ